MNLQVIKSMNGQTEYVLLPISVYSDLQGIIEKKLKKKIETQGDYIPFYPEDYIENPVSLARIKANLTQSDLAKRLGVTQAYISKLEKQKKVSVKILFKVKSALSKKKA